MRSWTARFYREFLAREKYQDRGGGIFKERVAELQKQKQKHLSERISMDDDSDMDDEKSPEIESPDHDHEDIHRDESRVNENPVSFQVDIRGEIQHHHQTVHRFLIGMISGPYNSQLSHPDFLDHPYVVFVALGVGVTPFLSLLVDINEKKRLQNRCWLFHRGVRWDDKKQDQKIEDKKGSYASKVTKPNARYKLKFLAL